MNSFDKKIKSMIGKEEVPQELKKHVEMTLDFLPERECVLKKSSATKTFCMAVAVSAVLIFVLILPNISIKYAEAAEQIPFIGNIIKAVTVRNYFYSDEHYEIDVKVPEIQGESQNADIKLVNEEIKELTSAIIEKFWDEYDASNNGYKGIYVDYHTITSVEDWFTLKVVVHETAASSNSYFKYYHIDRKIGKSVQLYDLFSDKSFTDVLSTNIREQIMEQIEKDPDCEYLIDDLDVGESLKYIEDTHNFYISENKELVIVFNKYEIAPGAMGCPEFVIPYECIENILKDEYKQRWGNN